MLGNALSLAFHRYTQLTLWCAIFRYQCSIMKTNLTRVGNSQSVLISKPFIEQSELSEEIEMMLRDNEIVLRSAVQPKKSA